MKTRMRMEMKMRMKMKMNLEMKQRLMNCCQHLSQFFLPFWSHELLFLWLLELIAKLLNKKSFKFHCIYSNPNSQSMFPSFLPFQISHSLPSSILV